MNLIDGRDIHTSVHLQADLVVVGSGPAGSAVAREASERGAKVLVMESGRWFTPDDFGLGAFTAMANMYRQMGSSVVVGAAPIPYVQGQMVGGSSPINGAICWRLPRDIYDGWVTADPALAGALSWEAISDITDEIEDRLGVAPTDPEIAGTKNLLMAAGAEALNLEHRPIRRNAVGCRGSGRCMQGCPHGAKRSVDRSLLADALHRGAKVLSACTATQVLMNAGRAVGVTGHTQGGGEVTVTSGHAVVLAASAVQTPALLMASGVRHGPVGQNFQCHPGVSLAGRFVEPVRMWEGATQGHEVVGLREEGLKFEALGFGLGILGSRMDGVGSDLAAHIAQMAHWLDWGVAIRSTARGRVRRAFGRTIVQYTPSRLDLERFRFGLRVLGEMMLAAGAIEVAPGVRGVSPLMSSAKELKRLHHHGPRSAGAYTAAITHMFGTCSMGSDPRGHVVRPDFRHHKIDRLYVADSSVFPTNLGVNPQIPIMAMATLCARHAMN